MVISEFQQLASQITIFLTPLMSLLVLTGTETVKEIGKSIGKETVNTAKELWSAIRSKNLNNDRKLIRVAEDIAENPDDTDYQEKMIKELSTSLQEHPDLAEKLSTILKNSDKAVQQVLIENESKVKNISLKIFHALGKQEVKVNKSIVDGDISIQQG